MRVGFNPHKDRLHEASSYTHQVVIPVYIPNHEDYFRDSFKVFKTCIGSLLKTVHQNTFITIVNNGSCKEVIDFLDDLLANKKINEVIHTENIGKLNAILKGITGNNIELVTIADSDVLFLDDWQKETVKVYNNFPKAGVVGIVPQIRVFGQCCGNLVVENFFSKKLKFSPVRNVEALKNFHKSLGWNDDYNKDYLKTTLTIEQNSETVLVGSGHFVATYRKELFREITTYIGYKLGGDSETYLDKIPLKYGKWRLTTYDNYAYHMGNVYEEWMGVTLNSIGEKEVTEVKLLNKTPVETENRLLYFLKNIFFVKIFNKSKYRRLFYRFKGMPKDMAAKY